MKLRKQLVIILILAVLLFAIYLIVQSVRFRVTSISPNGKILPLGTQEIIINFNHSLDESAITETNITIRPETVFTHSINNKTLTITLKQLLENNSEVIIKIENIKSSKGKEIKLVSREYRVEYVAFDKLSKQERDKQMYETNIEEKIYPIITKLPITIEDYAIDYELPSDNGKLILLIDVLGINDNSIYSPDSVSYLQIVRKKALDYLVSQGYKLEDYVIVYTEDQ